MLSMFTEFCKNSVIAAGTLAALLAASAPLSAVEESGALPLDELRSFADVYHQIRMGYVEEIDDSTLLEYAIQGMLMGLDPHSVYLTDDAFKNLQDSTSGEFSGLGLEVGTENGYVKIISPIDGSPAAEADHLHDEATDPELDLAAALQASVDCHAFALRPSRPRPSNPPFVPFALTAPRIRIVVPLAPAATPRHRPKRGPPLHSCVPGEGGAQAPAGHHPGAAADLGVARPRG